MGSDYDFLLIGLNADRKVLYDRINQRVDQMMREGLLDEARTLYEQAPEVQAAKGIGYKEFFLIFQGTLVWKKLLSWSKEIQDAMPSDN